jgi:hypothetical protein
MNAAPMIDADLAAIRCHNLNALFEEFIAAEFGQGASGHGAASQFSEKLGIRLNIVSMFRSRARSISDRVARQIEGRLGKPKGWLDAGSDLERSDIELVRQAWKAADDVGRQGLVELAEQLLQEAQRGGTVRR